MEFETNTAPPSDEQRRLAETKKLTLEPIHNDVAPEGASDSEIASRHLRDPAITNVTNDTEQNSTLIQPSKSVLDTPPSPLLSSTKRPFSHVAIVTVIVTTCISIAIAAFFLAK